MWSSIRPPDGVEDVVMFAHGGHIYVAGMLGVLDDLSALVEGGIAAETAQAFRHVERILKACDATIADIVKVSVYMVDLGEWEAMNAAYMDVFGPHTPARITVGVAALLFGARVEFDCIAYRG
jgi:2-iminobutanoate/2-iminopropanoate deaminase